ncbi:glutamate racemase [Runella salmonicolor]|uniref:Glutamate racemase n=1 Tax=Runella salmonicolor TaxID=2950278 RepID=A0ABT1FR88_9BACT|nr:glutamate racemase [Runella salmonicolor]MCP1383133.1 glutamate racemase [Runella salmonicolor]
MQGPIGVFDSGYGGLTILRELVKQLPQYDYLYLGDNARAPYGTRSFDTVYHYTLECVKHLFSKGCHLVILACNTASAKALRNIQQLDLPHIAPDRRVLGVIRPTTEVIGTFTDTQHIGIFATAGTVLSESYLVEIKKFFPDIHVVQEACPMWVPLIENGEFDSDGADYFVKKHVEHLLAQSPDIDAVLLGCTHYPLLIKKIRQFLPASIRIINQAEIVAHSLTDYLQRHPELEAKCSKNGKRTFYTTDSTEAFDRQSAVFFGQEVKSLHQDLGSSIN